MPQNCEDVTVPFGKHKGKRLGDLLEEDAGYLDWLQDCDLREPLASAVAEINCKYADKIEQAIEFKRSERW